MLLEVQNLTKQYTEGVGISAVSFAVEASECLAIVGESGSGKSTLLQILAGFLQADEGLMRLAGKVLPLPATMLVRGYPDIQLVPQDFKLLPNHKVWDNISYPIRNYPKKELQNRLAYLAELLNIQDLLLRYPRELSGGQQQRVAIARAMSLEPDVLLLDEPFNQADTQTKHQLEKILASLTQETQTALILVTHEATEALSLANQMLVLRAGKVLQYAPPQKIYQTPRTAYVGKLMGHLNELDKKTCLRAEHCYFADAPTAFEAEIIHVFYEGYRYRYTLRTGAGKEWIVYDTKYFEKKHYYLAWQASNLLEFS